MASFSPVATAPHSSVADIEAAAEVARLNRPAVASSEHQSAIDPGIPGPGPVTVSVLPLLAELQRGHAGIRQRQRSFRRVGLGAAADELAADTLELLPDVQCLAVAWLRNHRSRKHERLRGSGSGRRQGEGVTCCVPGLGAESYQDLALGLSASPSGSRIT